MVDFGVVVVLLRPKIDRLFVGSLLHMMLSIWEYVENETAKKSGVWNAPGVRGSPQVQSRCTYCNSIRMGIHTRWVDHFIVKTGTVSCSGPQQRKDEDSAKFNKRLSEFKDLKTALIAQAKNKRLAKEADEVLTGLLLYTIIPYFMV